MPKTATVVFSDTDLHNIACQIMTALTHGLQRVEYSNYVAERVIAHDVVTVRRGDKEFLEALVTFELRSKAKAATGPGSRLDGRRR